MLLYDPPSGWQYGFPKEYKPERDDDGVTEHISKTLKRDGYPEAMMTGKKAYNLEHIGFSGDPSELEELNK